MLSNKILKILTALYILFLIFGFFYVRDIIETERIDVVQQPKKEKAPEIKPITVYLDINNGKNTSSFKVQLNNTSTFEDMLEALRKDQNLKYEKIWYTYGVEILEINGVSGDDTHSWKIYKNDQDVTSQLEDLGLEDETGYKLVFE